MLEVSEQPQMTEMNQKPIDMETRIENELNGRDCSMIKELNLERCKATLIKGLNEEFKNLEMLNMSNIGLISLKGFPKLPALRQLDLSDNSIANGLDNLLGCPNLTHLKLTGNKFKCLEDFAPLAELKNLTHLGLINTEMGPMEDYRDQVFKMMPNLKYVDGFDRNEREEHGSDYDDSEEDDDEEEGEESEESEGGEAEQSVGLSYLQKSNLDEEDEQDEDFDVNKAKKKMKNRRRNEQGEEEDGDEEEEECENEQKCEQAAEANEQDGDENENDMSCDDGEKSEPGLSYLQKSNLDEESEDDEDFDIEKEMEIEKEKNGMAEDDEDSVDEEFEDEELSEDEKIVIKESEKEINQDGLKRKLKSESSKQI